MGVFGLVVAAVLLALVQMPVASAQDAVAEAAQPFDEWLDGLIAEARERGYNQTVIKQTLAGLAPLERVIQNDRSQAELIVGFERYYRSRISPRFVRQGRDLARRHRRTLASIEERYDVQRRFILAIWGIETRSAASCSTRSLWCPKATSRPGT